MRGLSADEKRATLDSFLEPDSGGLEIVDRSDLQAWSECPWRAKAIADGRCKTVGLAAEAGEAIHHALSVVTREWVESEIDVSPYEARDMLRGDLEAELRRVRPDLQPEALAGMMPSIWAWAKFLSGINPGNILGFDGGDDCDRSSQLAFDFPDLKTRVTSELDLLYANPQTIELVEWLDYKTGHATHDVYDIAKSFQFQLHALLILHRFKDVTAARLRVWDTRSNHVSYTVTFPRSRFADYEWRIRSAVETRRRHRDNPPTWPVSEKCAICPVASLCPVADESLHELATDPSGYLKKAIAVAARLAAMEEAMSKHVDATKQEIVCGATRYGRQKPKQNRKPEATFYELE